MKKNIFTFAFIFLISLAGCDSNQAYILTENLIGNWEGPNPVSNIFTGKATHVEYNFKNDGSYSKAFKRYNSENELVGYTNLETGTYSVDESFLLENTHGGFRADEEKELPKTIQALKDQQKAYVVDAFYPSRYSIAFDKNFETLSLTLPCDGGDCTIGPLKREWK